MPSDRPTRPHGTFTPASTISRVLGAAGYKAFRARRDTAFGGHRCSWDQNQQIVRVGYRCGDDTSETDRQTEREHALTLYMQHLTAKGYRVERDEGAVYVHIEKTKEK